MDVDALERAEGRDPESVERETGPPRREGRRRRGPVEYTCLLYTSDAADD